MITRLTILMVTVSLLFLSGQIYAANAISISKIDGFDSTTGGLAAQTPIRYYINYHAEYHVNGMLNGFRVYSPDSAIWQPLVAIELVNFDSLFDLDNGFRYLSVDGMGADTVLVVGITLTTPGLVPGFDKDYLSIETSFTEEQIGKTLCLDSSNSSWGGYWLWSSVETVPAWDGPHCYEIVDCCVGIRGDINGDGKGPNILDLTRLVDYIFRGATAPDCQLEADVNSDGLPSRITDLTYIVDYMHRGGPLPGSCPAD